MKPKPAEPESRTERRMEAETHRYGCGCEICRYDRMIEEEANREKY